MSTTSVLKLTLTRIAVDEALETLRVGVKPDPTNSIRLTWLRLVRCSIWADQGLWYVGESREEAGLPGNLMRLNYWLQAIENLLDARSGPSTLNDVRQAALELAERVSYQLTVVFQSHLMEALNLVQLDETFGVRGALQSVAVPVDDGLGDDITFPDVDKPIIEG